MAANYNNSFDAPTVDTGTTTRIQLPPLSMAARAQKARLGVNELDKNKVIEYVKTSFSNARQVNTIDLERFARYYRLVRNRQVVKNYRGLANLFVPEPYRIVRKKTAKLANAIKKIKAIPEEPQDVENSKTATHLLNFLRRKLNWPIIERTAIQESRIIGLAWLKCLWQVDKETPREPYKGFDISMQTADRVFLAPSTTMLDVFEGNIKWLVHEYYTDVETLKKNPNYKPEDIRLLMQRGGMAQKPTPLSMARIMNENRQSLAMSQKIKKIQVLEYWGKYNSKAQQADDTAEEQDILAVVADGAVLLRFGDNPYAGVLSSKIPFVPIVGNVIGQELYPVGDIEPTESLFNELNDTRNQRMDTVTLNIDPPKEVLRGANIDEKELIARRGWVIHSNIPEGVRFIPPDMQGVRAAIDEEKIIRSDIQQASGIIDFTQGAEVQGGLSVDTARGAIIAKGEADVVTADEIELIKTSLKMLYKMVLAYSQTFLDKQFVIRVLENGAEGFLNIDRNSVIGNLDIDIEMQTLQDSTTEQQLKLMMFNQAKTTPGANIGKFFTDVLEAFFENVNIAEYYQEPQQQGPPPPSVNISLKGELTGMEADEVFKTIPGVDPKSADPLLRQEHRELLRGNMPEDQVRQQQNQANQTHDLDMLAKQKELMTPPEEPEESSNE